MKSNMKKKLTISTLVLLTLIMAALSMGCASVNLKKPFADVTKTVEAHTGQKVQWIRDSAEDKQVEQAVQESLERELTAERAVQVALLNNRTLQATFEEIGIAQADLVQAGLLKNPGFFLNVGFPSGSTESTVSTTIAYSVVQDFLDILILPLRKKIAAQQLEQTKLHVSDQVIKLAAEVKTAFYTLQARQQLLMRLRTIQDLNDMASEFARRQHAAGNISDLDLQNHLAISGISRVEVTQAEAQRRVARERLNRLMGLRGGQTNWKIADTLTPIPEKEIPTEHLESLALQKRLDLEAARREVDTITGALALRNKTRFFLGDLAIGVASEREPDRGGPRVTGPTIQLDVPIFDQGQAQIARLEAQLRQSQRRLEALTTEIRSQVREVQELMLTNRDLAKHYEQVLVPQRTLILNLTVEQYNFMLKGTYDVLWAKQNEVATERSYIEAWRDYWIARSSLERAVGGQLPTQQGGREP